MHTQTHAQTKKLVVEQVHVMPSNVSKKQKTILSNSPFIDANTVYQLFITCSERHLEALEIVIYQFSYE